MPSGGLDGKGVDVSEQNKASNAVRLSCRAAVVGAAITVIAVLIVVVTVSGPTLDVKTAQSPAFLAANLLSAVGALLLVYGLPGVFARWREGWGRTGLAGIALLSLAAIILSFTSLLVAIIEPWLAEKAPELVKDPGPPLFLAISFTSLAALSAGTILTAIPILRRRVGPRWIGFLLVASAVMLPVYIYAAFSSTNLLLSLVGSLSPLCFLVAVGSLGYFGARETQAATTESMPSAAQRA
jgi:hypothetical protein